MKTSGRSVIYRTLFLIVLSYARNARGDRAVGGASAETFRPVCILLKSASRDICAVASGPESPAHGARNLFFSGVFWVLRSRKRHDRRGWAMSDDSCDLSGLQRELRGFCDFVRSLDAVVETIALRPGDRASLKSALSIVERAIDERARRRPRHPQTDVIARDLKETRRAALRRRFSRLAR